MLSSHSTNTDSILLENLIRGLSNPLAYPHPVEIITTIETHISVVFLTGKFAYKLKKPVNFGFLDFSSLAKRQHFCELELQLNRRTAPQLYLAVVPVYFCDKDGIRLQAPQNEKAQPIDYLVKMQQFDPNAVLGRQLVQKPLNQVQLEALAHQIAQLHQQAETVALPSPLGTPSAVLQPMLDNFRALEICFDPQQHPFLAPLFHWTETQFKTLSPELTRRRQQGKIRACHGDLHLDNIALLEDVPVLFDGIEFNEAFRWIDGISDLAFLLMDLSARQHSAQAWQLLSLYLHQTQDYSGLVVLRFYLVYRAMVRAKITNLRAEQLLAGCEQRRELCAQAEDYVQLAHHFSQAPSHPKLILLQGVSGSGKSHLAQELQAWMPAVVISSDRTRKHLFGVLPKERLTADARHQLYSPQMSQTTYKTLLQNARTSLTAGWHTVVDATFLKHAHRQPFYELAAELHIPVYLLYLEVNDVQQIEQALQQRGQANLDPSDADAQIMQNQLPMIEPPSQHEPALWLNANQLRQTIPIDALKNFLGLPITLSDEN
ncbi:MAG: AAA family ATPase [Thiotrichales bacterium]|nr:AAA family ATPase [Thiotrichales bacterium]